jgi:hypothetical protein
MLKLKKTYIDANKIYFTRSASEWNLLTIVNYILSNIGRTDVKVNRNKKKEEKN